MTVINKDKEKITHSTNHTQVGTSVGEQQLKY